MIALSITEILNAALDMDDMQTAALAITSDELSVHMPKSVVERLALIGMHGCSDIGGDDEFVRTVARAIEIVRSRNA